MLLQLLRIPGGYGGRFTMMVDELLREHAAERHIVIVLAGNDIGTVEKTAAGHGCSTASEACSRAGVLRDSPLHPNLLTHCHHNCNMFGVR